MFHTLLARRLFPRLSANRCDFEIPEELDSLFKELDDDESDGIAITEFSSSEQTCQCGAECAGRGWIATGRARRTLIGGSAPDTARRPDRPVAQSATDRHTLRGCQFTPQGIVGVGP